MLRAIPHLAGFVLPLALVAGVNLGGAWTFLPFALVLGLLPIADWLAGVSLRNPEDDAEDARHSDHHLVAAKRYQLLDYREDAPQLPAGYGAMFVAALCPPLWRRLMDPRVAAWRRGQGLPDAPLTHPAPP